MAPPLVGESESHICPLFDLRNGAYNLFLHHVTKEKSDGQLHQCAKRINDKLERIDEVVRPIFPS
jgi:hypothetical protein